MQHLTAEQNALRLHYAKKQRIRKQIAKLNKLVVQETQPEAWLQLQQQILSLQDELAIMQP
jgi:hypothetical protein